VLVVPVALQPQDILIRPVVSEKSYTLIEQGKYSFRVHPDAHKTQVRQAVEELFNVHVQRVNILTTKPKPKRRGLQRGTRPGWKKAVVQLRAGETIQIFEGAQV
jgi:large subunit ribosomal protein L23